MSKTNIEYFNEIYKNFVKEIGENLPEYKMSVIKQYEQLLSYDNEMLSEVYVKEFMSSISDHIDAITKDDDSIFYGEKELYFLRDIDFRYLWKIKMNRKTKKTIKKYLKTLYLVGGKILSSNKEIDDIITNFTKGNTQVEHTTTNATSTTASTDTESTTASIDTVSSTEQVSNIDEEAQKLLNVLESMSSEETQSGETSSKYEKMMEESTIGKLAQEIASEINLDSMNLENIENPADIMKCFKGDTFMNMVQNVGEKIQTKLTENTIDSNTLLGEAQQMMSMLGGEQLLGGLFNSSLFGGNSSATQQATQQAAEQVSNMRGRTDNRTSSTRDRLKKKLEQRKKNK